MKKKIDVYVTSIMHNHIENLSQVILLAHAPCRGGYRYTITCDN
jgi:hypothetical protein